MPTGVATMAVGKNSSYYSILSQQILKFFVSGRMDILKQKHIKQEPNCEPLVKTFPGLSVKKIIAPFLVVAIGVILGLLVFGLESCFRSEMKGAECFESDDDVKDAFSLIKEKLGRLTDIERKERTLKLPLKYIFSRYSPTYLH